MTYTEDCLKKFKAYFKKVYLVYGTDYNAWNYRQGPHINGMDALDYSWAHWINQYLEGERKFNQKFIYEVINNE